jgi:hypothetical protein
VILKEWFRRADIDSPFFKEDLKNLRGLGPERAQTLLSTFAEQVYLVWPHELKVEGPEIDDLLDSRPRVKHDGKERVVSPTISCPSIDSGQHRLDLTVLEIVYGPRTRSFERYPQDTLTLFQFLGVLAGQITKESVNGGQADISGCRIALPVGLEVLKEGDDFLGRDIVEIKTSHIVPLLGREEA